MMFAPEAMGSAAVRVPAERIAAYRRPTLVLLVYVFRVVAALLAAAPLAMYAASALAGYRSVDAALFAPGGVLLAELARVGANVWQPLTATATSILLVASLLGLIPMAVLIAALGYDRAPAADIGGRVTRALPSLIALLGLALLAEVVVLIVMVLLGNWLVSRTGWVAPREQIARAIVVVVALLAVVCIGALHDVARVVAVDEGRGAYSAASIAVGTIRRAPLALAWAYAWRAALAGAGIVAAIAFFAGTVGIIAHQLAVFGAVLARASWLAAVLRHLRRHAPPP